MIGFEYIMAKVIFRTSRRLHKIIATILMSFVFILRCKASPGLRPCLRFDALSENKILLELTTKSYAIVY